MSPKPHRRLIIGRRAARLAITSAVLLAGATVAAPPASASGLNSVGQVQAAVITLGKPTISGTAVVDGQLIAHVATAPSGTSLAYSWKAGIGQVATTNYYQPKPADVGKTITVTVTASKTGYTSSTKTSDPTAAVAKASFASNYTFAISGAANVGSTLAFDYTSGSGVVSPKASGSSFLWLRDGAPIGGATSGSYVLTSADLGKTITLTVTVTRAGYNDLTITSTNAIGPIGAAAITLGKPTISGAAVVDGLLTAQVGTVSPSGTSLAYSWKAGTDEVATTSYYQPKPADVGKTITVTVTASKTGFTSSTKTSDPTAAVAKASFASTYTFEISGEAKVGSTLAFDYTSGSGVVSPKASGSSFLWLRDGAPIGGATSGSYVLTSADLGKTITLTVTVTRAGYNDLTITSTNAIGPIAAATG